MKLEMKSAALVAFIAFGHAEVAAAQSMPRYEVEKYCEEVSEFGGGSRTIYNGCIDMEQTAYNVLRKVWTTVPRQTQSYCNEVAQFSGGSYSILKGCVDIEISAGANTKAFEY